MKKKAIIKQKLFAFTLIELLIVVAIIGLLAVTAFIAINPVERFKQARDSQRLSDLSNLSHALEAQRTLNGKYPNSTGSPNYQIENAPWGSPWPGVLNVVPKDPLASQSYAYISDGDTYQLYAKFESSNVDQNFACPSGCGPGGTYKGGMTSGGTSSSLATIAGPSPTPSPVAIYHGNTFYSIGGNLVPKINKVYFNPLDPAQNTSQQIRVEVVNNSPVTSVSANFITDSGTQTFNLTRESGAAYVPDGGLQGSGGYNEVWSFTNPNVNFTYNTTYQVKINAGDGSNSSFTTITIR